jgi:hypothetical protein
MLIRNLNIRNGLSNGTRMRVIITFIISNTIFSNLGDGPTQEYNRMSNHWRR